MIEVVQNIEEVAINVTEISANFPIEITENNQTTILNVQEVIQNVELSIIEQNTTVTIEITQGASSQNTYYPSGW